MPPNPTIRSTSPVGRYALGVNWSDGHESILPLANLRAHCPCDACSAARGRSDAPGEPTELRSLETIGEESLFLSWVDGHETLYLTGELRALCRCAYCIGEPERPITG